MNSTEQLIKELTKDHTKIIRNFSPALRLMLFLYGTFILASIVLYFKTPFIFRLQNISHLVEILGMFLFINAFTYFGLQSLVPGSNKTKSFYLLIATSLFLILAMSYRIIAPQTHNVVRDYCELEAIAVSIFTTFIGHCLLKKSEFAQKSAFGYLIFFALPMLATIFLHLTCELTFFHVLSCHIISPMIVPLTYTIIKGKK